jgi:tRNA/tmRNA/rRNA uracil-C5-methylase (TrmA/RlmC/RlmD family)
VSTPPQQGLQVGDAIRVEVGPVAHGGHFVARHEGRVVFVRHALPGETVTVEITEDDGSFWRGDAVDVHEASPHRVEAPCPYAGPGLCGGCDLQHVEAPHQRELKAAVVREQLQRLAGLEREVVVEEVEPLLGWRSRMQYVDLPDGRRGLRKHRSHDVQPVEECLIAAPDAVEQQRGGRGRTVREQVLHRSFDVDADGFWQPHVSAPQVLVETVLGMLEPRPGESVLDLFSGVGVFAGFLAERVGPDGAVLAVEGDRRASELAAANLADLPQARSVHGRVDRVLHRGVGPHDLVVLDPPRVGAKRQVVRSIAALEPRAVAYVACDPAALARDLAYFAEQDYLLADLRALDLFPMTHHVECVALLEPKVSPAGR